VNITKFGAFVNILPGRDGLLHISKIGGGKRIDRVEDVLELGQSVDVVVEDIDPNGKVSLRMAGDASDSGGSDRGGSDRGGSRPERSAPADDSGDSDDAGAADSVSMSFEDDFEASVGEEFGELGPEGAELNDGGGNNRGRGRGGRGGGNNRGGGRNRR